MNLPFDAQRAFWQILPTRRIASAGLSCLLALMQAQAGDVVNNPRNRTGDTVLEPGQAIGRYLERQTQGADPGLGKAEQRMREAKVIDTMWHLATQPIASNDENGGLAGRENDYLRAVARTVASSYPGLGGAAAYAAWYTFRQTGNADLAFRVGVLAAATSEAFPADEGAQLEAARAMARKAAVAGAIGGLAVAAAGGNQQSIQEGFLRAGGMVLIQDGYKRYNGSKLVARAAEPDAYCMAAVRASCPRPDLVVARDDKGNIVYNKSQNQHGPAQTGDMGATGTSKWNEDRAVFMRSVARVPGMNALALFHGQWSIGWDMSSIMNSTWIGPAIVMTYAGTGAPYYESLGKTAVAAGDKNKIPGVRQAEMVAAVTSTALPLEFKTNSSFEAFLCQDDGHSNSLVVDQPDGTTTNCRVVAITSNGRITLIGEGSHVDECARKAENHIRDQIQFGHSCFIREKPAPDTLIENASKIGVADEQGIASPGSDTFGPAGMAVLAFFSGGLGYLVRSVRSKIKVKSRRSHKPMGTP